MPLDDVAGLDGLILAVPHRVVAEAGWQRLFAALAPGGVFIDVKSAIARTVVESHFSDGVDPKTASDSSPTTREPSCTG